MTRTRIALIIGAAALAAVGTSIGTALAIGNPTATNLAPSGYSSYTAIDGTKNPP